LRVARIWPVAALLVGYRPTVGYARCQCGSTSRLATGQIGRNDCKANTVTQHQLRKLNKRRIMKWPALFLLTLSPAIYAADNKPKAETFLDPARAGQDYADQGEYKND